MVHWLKLATTKFDCWQGRIVLVIQHRANGTGREATWYQMAQWHIERESTAIHLCLCWASNPTVAKCVLGQWKAAPSRTAYMLESTVLLEEKEMFAWWVTWQHYYKAFYLTIFRKRFVVEMVCVWTLVRMRNLYWNDTQTCEYLVASLPADLYPKLLGQENCYG